MIIKYPTGLYRLSGSNSVTYLVSNTKPPRTDLLYPKIADGVASRKLPSYNFDRSAVGDLIFSISSNDNSVTSSSNTIYETGQILEFGDNNIRSIDNMVVDKVSEIRHDLKKYSYDIDDALTVAGDYFVEVSNKLSDIKRDRYNSEVIISNLQKQINDLNRNISALQIVYDDTSNNDVKAALDKLNEELTIASDQLNKEIDNANKLAAEAADLQEKLRTVSGVVK